jgi:2-phosphosulfolactate phosphatase
MFYDQRDFGARFDWGPDAVRRLVRASDVVVIVDVLSFGTAVDVAVARGATVFPCRSRDDAAVAYAREVGAALAVGRSQVDPAHPYSLSPASLLAIGPGVRLVLPSPNGATLTEIAAESGAVVLAGCLRNPRAVARAARALGEAVTVVAAGERWERDRGALRPAVEDLVGAGAILAALAPSSPSPEAVAAIGAFAAVADGVPGFLRACASGRELREDGFARDVEIAAELDASDTAPLLTAGAFTGWSP